MPDLSILKGQTLYSNPGDKTILGYWQPLEVRSIITYLCCLSNTVTHFLYDLVVFGFFSSIYY